MFWKHEIETWQNNAHTLVYWQVSRIRDEYASIFVSTILKASAKIRHETRDVTDRCLLIWYYSLNKPTSITLSGSNQLRTSSEPDSVMEFGGEPASSC